MMPLLGHSHINLLILMNKFVARYGDEMLHISLNATMEGLGAITPLETQVGFSGLGHLGGSRSLHLFSIVLGSGGDSRLDRRVCGGMNAQMATQIRIGRESEREPEIVKLGDELLHPVRRHDGAPCFQGKDDLPLRVGPMNSPWDAACEVKNAISRVGMGDSLVQHLVLQPLAAGDFGFNYIRISSVHGAR